MKKSCSLNIEAIKLKTVLFYSRYVKLGPVIHSVLIGHSFPSKQEIFYRKPESPFRKSAKTSENSKQHFPLFSFLIIMTLECVHVFCPHESMESPLNELFTLGGRLFNSSKRKNVLKRAESHRCEVNTLGTSACNFNMFF